MNRQHQRQRRNDIVSYHLFHLLVSVSIGLLFSTFSGVVVSGEVIRKGNLDYFDVETMSFFLDPYSYTDALLLSSLSNDNDNTNDDDIAVTSKKNIAPYDVVVLLYAKWCKNCHALAPSYERVARSLQSGTNKKSNLIIGLFDCEATTDHSTICTKAGVTHYPTIYYIPLSRLQYDSTTSTSTTSTTDKKDATKRSSTKKQKNKPPSYFIQFGGNWQYGELILYDWIVAMRAISRYQNSSFRTNVIGSLLSKLFFFTKNNNNVQKKTTDNTDDLSSFLGINKPNTGTTGKTAATPKINRGLPIGIPGISKSTLSSSSSSSSTTTSSTGTKADKVILAEYDKIKKQYETSKKAVTRYSIIIDSMLTPSSLPDSMASSSSSLFDKATSSSSTDNNTSTSVNRNSTSTTTISSDGPIKTYVDMFTYMNVTNMWTSVMKRDTKTNTTTTNTNNNNNIDIDDDDLDADALVACITDLTYDYCTRLGTQYMYEWIQANPTITDITDTVYEQYNKQRTDYINTIEPYCTILDECIVSNFIAPTCRPITCPFYDDTACRYLTSCLSNDIFDQYSTAVRQQQQQQKQQSKSTTGTTATSSTKSTSTAAADATKKTTTTTTTTTIDRTQQKQQQQQQQQNTTGTKEQVGTESSSSNKKRWGLR